MSRNPYFVAFLWASFAFIVTVSPFAIWAAIHTDEDQP